MWAVVNHTPYAAEGGWVQDKDANKIWLVAVKATYELPAGGGTRLTWEQQPVLRMSEPRGEEGKSSLRYESDLLGVNREPTCSSTAVLGRSAAAARSPPTVLVRVGPIRKQLRVFGDRSWRRNIVGRPTITDPEPFESMPITFERAYGGWDRGASDPAEHRLEARNPVGTGFSTSAANAIGKALPNVEDPGQLIAAWDDRPIPAGLPACRATGRRVGARGSLRRAVAGSDARRCGRWTSIRATTSARRWISRCRDTCAAAS